MSARVDIAIKAKNEDATADIQRAIDGASRNGGGRVTLSAGRHVSGGLCLKSDVELHLENDAILEFLADYDAYIDMPVSVFAEKSDRAMIVAVGAQNISVTGSGRIEAGGESFIIGNDEAMGTYIPAHFRPRVMVLEHCQNVRLQDFTVANSPMWTLHMVNCENLLVRQVCILNNRRLPNTDGIVLDSCREVVIEACDISTADDGICLKTSAGADGRAVGVCENVSVRHCKVSSLSCALKLGTESFGDFLNVTFEDCQVIDSNRGLGLFSRDGGEMRNIRFSRIEVDCQETRDGFWGSGEALTVTVVDRKPDRPAGRIENLAVENLTGRMEGAINLISTSDAGIHNVVLNHISLRQAAGKLGTGRRYDLRPTNADIAPSVDAAGRANAWTLGSDGRVIGLEDYPGGMPAIYLAGVHRLTTSDVDMNRTKPLPVGWNVNEIVTMTRTLEGSR
ncbi:glycoside hydrolase family 28 protein [Agrobacterium vaccinii]|uniref:polygalacturonase PglB n=1 Tax=Agrobacterium vaccinii TaxID=2735528 RepID=UPI001E5F9D72|nr:glycoside hydrolase family 28 protein [Agrobacterium vaccinii]UHS63837.1 glycoside hydrolase family 28 protein [Agrobacterium vaccinii]